MAAPDLDLLILLLRLAFVGLLYLFLAQVVLALRRDLQRAAEGRSYVMPPEGRLAIIDSDQADITAGQTLDLRPNTTVGRSAQNTLSLNDTFLSASHARITFRLDRWWLEDLGSTNGTYLNGRLIGEPTPLEFGDIIAIGRSKFKLVH